MRIRKAYPKDIKGILALLSEVLEIHAMLRPDLFVSGTTKYTTNELATILTNERTPVFVAVDEKTDRVLGYCFCVLKNAPFSTNMYDVKTLYIDDLCVSAKQRNKHIGRELFEYVRDFAKKQECYNITLNVWEGNDSARAFYEKRGMFVRETTMELVLDD